LGPASAGQAHDAGNVSLKYVFRMTILTMSAAQGCKHLRGVCNMRWSAAIQIGDQSYVRSFGAAFIVRLSIP
jgi:hypothetical protein